LIQQDPVQGENSMNRRTPGLKTVIAIQGFLQFKAAEGLSARMIESYSRDLRQWVEYMGERQVVQITILELRQYMVYLLIEYQHRRLTGNNEQKLSPKTVEMYGSRFQHSSTGPVTRFISPM
jgi:integrase/recombinase XerD